MNKGQSEALELLMNYGWAILIIIVVVGSLFILGVFKSPSQNNIENNYSISCKTLCNQSSLQYNNWHKEGGCIVCDCIKKIPMTCKNNISNNDNFGISDSEGD